MEWPGASADKGKRKGGDPNHTKKKSGRIWNEHMPQLDQ
jgi:hypothetical protein